MTYKRNVSKICFIILMLLFVVSCFFACSPNGNKINNIEDLNNRHYKISVDAGSAAANTAQSVFDKAEIVYTPSISDAYMSVSKGKTDAFVYGRIFMQYALASGSIDNLVILNNTLDTTDIAVGVSKSNASMLNDINKFIKESKQNGVLDDMYNRWVVKADTTMMEFKKPDNPSGVLKIGTSGLVEPITYYDGEQNLKGYDIEFIYRLANYLNMDIELEAMGYDALIASLEAEKLDMVIADLNVTEERKKVIAMSDPYRTTETAVVVRKDMVEDSMLNRIEKLDDLNGKSIGIIAGSSYDGDVQKRFPNSKIEYYVTYAELIAAMKRGIISSYITDKPVADYQTSQMPELKTVDGVITQDNYAYMIAPDNIVLKEEVNQAIKQLKDEGTINKLKDKWMNRQDDVNLPEIDKSKNTKGTLKVVTCADQEPFAFVREGEVVGFDIDLITYIANKIGYDIKITNTEFSSLMPNILTGKHDIAVGCITVTPERQESIAFTDVVFESGIVAVKYDSNAENGNFFTKIKDSFIRTFVTESRWKLIIEGLVTTLIISLSAAILGSLLGFLFSFLLRSKNKIVAGISKALSTIHEALPILIILMIFYYIIFGKTTIPAIVISIIVFSIDFANTVAGTLNTGVAAVDKGEIEAAYAMGYTKWQTFNKITFPQAARQMMGAYNGAIIGQIKGTSVVGFITVHDLTRAGDIIRSRTYEAFFPLIVIALIYFLLSFLIVKLLRLVEKKLEPKDKKRREIKGVNTHD